MSGSKASERPLTRSRVCQRFLRGEKPACLLVATKFHFAINPNTAKSLRLQIRSTLLALADEVTE